MSITSIVNIGPDRAVLGTLAAFVGGEVRGVATAGTPLPFGPYTGITSFLMTIYANSNSETISFKFWDGTTLFDSMETLTFATDAIVGSVPSPFLLTTAIEQRVLLARGWTWFSLNVHGSDSSVGTVLASLTGTTGDFIKDDSQFAQFCERVPANHRVARHSLSNDRTITARL